MNQKEALDKLKAKKQYIDDDVFQIISEKIRRNIREEVKKEVEKEKEEFAKKVIILLNKGISITAVKNMILSDFYQNKVLHRSIYT